ESFEGDEKEMILELTETAYTNHNIKNARERVNTIDHTINNNTSNEDDDGEKVALTQEQKDFYESMIMNPVNRIHIVDLLGPGETLKMYRDEYNDLTVTTSVTTTNFNGSDEPPKTPTTSVSSRHFNSSFEPTPTSGYDDFSYSPVSPTPSWSDFEQKYRKKSDDERITINEINNYPLSPLLLLSSSSPSPLSKSNSTQSIKRLFDGKSLNENLSNQKDDFDSESFPSFEGNTKSLSREKNRCHNQHLLLSEQLQQEINEFNNGYDGDIE
ncbi:11540_t:CDS:2, partial [Ambispora leptoticha]